MKTFAAKSLALIACLHLVGGHWFALQTVAWVGMFVENQREASLGEALEKTFDGQHPCALCCAIEKGKQSEDSQKLVEITTKLNAVLVASVALPPQTAVDLVYFDLFVVPGIVRLPSPESPPWLG